MFLPNDLRLTQNIVPEPLNSSTVCPKCMSTPLFSRRSSEYCTQCTQDSQKHNTFLPTFLFVHFFCLSFIVICSFFFDFFVRFASFTFIHQSWTWRNSRVTIVGVALRLRAKGFPRPVRGTMTLWFCWRNRVPVRWPVRCGREGAWARIVAGRTQRRVQIICLLFLHLSGRF